MNDNDIKRKVLGDLMGAMDKRDRDELTGRFLPKKQGPKKEEELKEKAAELLPVEDEATPTSIDPLVLLAKRYE